MKPRGEKGSVEGSGSLRMALLLGLHDLNDCMELRVSVFVEDTVWSLWQSSGTRTWLVPLNKPPDQLKVLAETESYRRGGREKKP